jgi:murein DD-endopeptidase MepM/ murein hydrolase activator NlpD
MRRVVGLALSLDKKNLRILPAPMIGSLLLLLLSGCGAPSQSLPPKPLPIAGQISEETAPTVPAVLPVVSSAAQPIATQSIVDLPEAAPNPVSDWRPPPYAIPLAIRPTDHYYFARPVPSGEVNWPNPRYRYGSTAFGEETIHTGVDLGAERDTPVLAAGAGEITWVGYGLYRGVFDLKDPYGLAVAIRHDFGHERQLLYTIYAHLSSTVVWPGQRVTAGEQIGTVGDTGHASGPHLHFEVREGENRYFATQNPELWMVPAEGWGVLAGRVTDTYGRDLPEFRVQVKSVETEQIWEVWTYALGTVNSDAYYQENFVIGDLPAGPYQLEVLFLGRSYSAFMYVYPGQTNFVRFQGRQGLTVEPRAHAALSLIPPYP